MGARSSIAAAKSKVVDMEKKVSGMVFPSNSISIISRMRLWAPSQAIR